MVYQLAQLHEQNLLLREQTAIAQDRALDEEEDEIQKRIVSYLEILYEGTGPYSVRRVSQADPVAAAASYRDDDPAFQNARLRSFAMQELVALFRRTGRRIEVPGANLAGCDLAGLDLAGADLSFADLRLADLRDCILSEASLNSANLSGASLVRANLKGAMLEATVCLNAKFRSDPDDGTLSKLPPFDEVRAETAVVYRLSSQWGDEFSTYDLTMLRQLLTALEDFEKKPVLAVCSRHWCAPIDSEEAILKLAERSTSPLETSEGEVFAGTEPPYPLVAVLTNDSVDEARSSIDSDEFPLLWSEVGVEE